MWEINSLEQTKTFILAFLLGCLLSILYIVFYSLSHINKRRAVVLDIIFWVIAALITFSFLLLTTNGEIRGFVIFSLLSGFIIFFKSFSKFLLVMLINLFRKLKITAEKIDGFFTSITDKISERFTLLFTKLKSIKNS